MPARSNSLAVCRTHACVRARLTATSSGDDGARARPTAPAARRRRPSPRRRARRAGRASRACRRRMRRDSSNADDDRLLRVGRREAADVDAADRHALRHEQRRGGRLGASRQRDGRAQRAAPRAGRREDPASARSDLTGNAAGRGGQLRLFLAAVRRAPPTRRSCGRSPTRPASGRPSTGRRSAPTGRMWAASRRASTRMRGGASFARAAAAALLSGAVAPTTSWLKPERLPRLDLRELVRHRAGDAVRQPVVGGHRRDVDGEQRRPAAGARAPAGRTRASRGRTARRAAGTRRRRSGRTEHAYAAGTGARRPCGRAGAGCRRGRGSGAPRQSRPDRARRRRPPPPGRSAPSARAVVPPALPRIAIRAGGRPSSAGTARNMSHSLPVSTVSGRHTECVTSPSSR